MKIGLIFFSDKKLRLLNHKSLFRLDNMLKSLKGTYEQDIEFLNYKDFSSTDDFLSSVDVIMGSLNLNILKQRNEHNLQVPYLIFLLGDVTRGLPISPKVLSLMKNYDQIVCNCAADKRIISKFYKPPSSGNIILLPNLLKLPEISLKTNKETYNGEYILLYSGRITPQKNIQDMLKMVKYLKKFYKVKLIIAGNFDYFGSIEFNKTGYDYAEYLRHEIIGMNLHDEVKLVGYQDYTELVELYRSSYCLINTTLLHDENFGLSQIEAMAAGLPVICSDWGGLKDTVVQDKCGYRMNTWLLKDGGAAVDWFSGAKYIEHLIKNRELYEETSRYAYNFARENYSFSSLLRSYISAGEEALNSVGKIADNIWEISEIGLDFEKVRNRDGQSYMSSGKRRGNSTYYRLIFSEYCSERNEILAGRWAYERKMLWKREDKVSFNDYLWSKTYKLSNDEKTFISSLINNKGSWIPTSSNKVLMGKLLDKGLIGICNANLL